MWTPSRDVRVEPADVVKRAFTIFRLAGDFVHDGLVVGRLRIPCAAVVEVGAVDLRDALATAREDARFFRKAMVMLRE